MGTEWKGRSPQVERESKQTSVSEEVGTSLLSKLDC